MMEMYLFSFFLFMTRMFSLFQKSSRVLLGQFSVNFLSSKVFLQNFGNETSVQCFLLELHKFHEIYVITFPFCVAKSVS